MFKRTSILNLTQDQLVLVLEVNVLPIRHIGLGIDLAKTLALLDIDALLGNELGTALVLPHIYKVSC